MNIEELLSFENLLDAAHKCYRSVSWKSTVRHYMLNEISETMKLHDELMNGAYKPRKTREIDIYYPKKRKAMSIAFRDRVYQRVLNDLVLYPNVTKSFIYDNCACQKGKGTTFCRNRVKKHMWNHFCNHGLDGYVLQIDIHGYYPNMRKEAIMERFAKCVDPEILAMVSDILDQQHGDEGFYPGSQMLQIAGIGLLDPLDHRIKEKLHVKHYVRYMDDFWLLLPTKEEAESALADISEWLSEYGFELNPTKTQIRPLKKGFELLGFKWRMTDTGKVIMTPLDQNIRHTRNKIVRMAHKGISPERSKVSLDCWIAHAEEGTAYHAIENMKKLWRTENAQIH